MGNEITAGEFIKMLVTQMSRAKIQMPFHEEEKWHLLFYKLKLTDSPNKPHFLGKIKFDWDGAYPKSRQISEFLQALHWNASLSASNPYYEKISLPEGVEKLWIEHGEKLDLPTKKFLEEAVSLAKEEFSPAARRERPE
jgi:hypothetical protein